ncbi:MAG: helix-turn-helix domain-containing protein, partial [Myxococcota bacterium]
DLTPELRGEGPEDGPETGVDTLATLERKRLVQALEQTSGKKAQAAVLLDMSRSTLWRKLKEHGLA